MGGLEFTLARRWLRNRVFTFGLRVELGYLFLGRFDYSGGQEEVDEDDESLVPNHLSSLGTLELSGLSTQINVLFSF